MAIDLQRRKAVMGRSIKLGHCVCNPKNPCPCDIFREYNVCPCAGEKMPVKPGPVPLMRTVRKAGCASKIGQADLLRILSRLPAVDDPNVVIGTAAGDDAGVYRLNDRQCLVQTVDVFTPVVDDPHLFGRIAAANSLSDVYAMGGRPLTALSIVGFPIDELDGAILEAILRGGMDTLELAGCSLIGGHSINDEEIKCGFAVTGLIDAGEPVQRSGGRPGDVLVLTKPLGTGMISFGAQIGWISPDVLEEVGESMATLNRDAAELMVRMGAHACTDITGFGLAGHLVEMIRAADLDAEIDLSALPVFAAVQDCLENDVLSGAIERNQEYSMAWVSWNGAAPADTAERNLQILYDPQTSGGLLVALPEENSREFVRELQARGHTATSIFGRLVRHSVPDRPVQVRILNEKLGNFHGRRRAVSSAKIDRIPIQFQIEEEPMKSEREDNCQASEASCCSGAAESGREDTSSYAGLAGQGGADNAPALFAEFMKAANAPGLIDARAKKLMAIALSIAHHCEPCLKIHLKSALSMEIPKAEMDEAANLAIAFGGCTAMMFYKETCKELGI